MKGGHDGREPVPPVSTIPFASPAAARPIPMSHHYSTRTRPRANRRRESGGLDPLVGEGPDRGAVLDALDDGDCRTIVRHLDSPTTARALAEQCDLPLSTTYRKLDLLAEASLVTEVPEIKPGGHHTTRFRLDFEAVRLSLDDDRRLRVDVVRPEDAADRLELVWSEVGRET